MKTEKIKIIFFGTPEFAIPAFRFLIEKKHNIIAAVTVPDKPAGRQKILTSPPVKITAQQNNIPVFQPTSLKNPSTSSGQENEFFQKFKELKPDLCVIVAYGKIIPKDYLDVPKYGFVNIHPSLLPKYRGPSPIQTAILNGEKETGVTIMLADEETDHGSILNHIKYQILNDKTFEEISQELAEAGAKLLVETLPGYLTGQIKPKQQNHSEATFTKMFSREDGKINWDEPAEKIFNQIRALNPEPGTWTIWRGKILNIAEAEFACKGSLCKDCRDNLPAGKVVSVDNRIAVATSKCYLVIKSLQFEGGKKMDARAYLNGHPDFAGSQLD